MNVLLNLNKTTKIIIMSAYTLIMLLVLVMFFGQLTTEGNYKSYDKIPYDENIFFGVRMYESRTYSSLAEDSTTKERSTWSLITQVLPQPTLDPNKTIQNINVYLAIEAMDGSFTYRECTPKDDSYKQNFDPAMTFNSESSINASQEQYNSAEETYTFVDQSPKTVYARINYRVRFKNSEGVFQFENHTLTYQYDVYRAGNTNFDQYQATQVVGLTSTASRIFIGDEAYVGVEIMKRMNSEVSTVNKTVRDNFQVRLYYNPIKTEYIDLVTVNRPEEPEDGHPDGFKYLQPEEKVLYTYRLSTKRWVTSNLEENIAYTLKSNNDTYLYKSTVYTTSEGLTSRSFELEKVANPSALITDDKIKNIEIAVFGKAENDAKDHQNYLSDYIQLGYLTGKIISSTRNASTTSTLPTSPSTYLSSTVHSTSVGYDTLYKISEVYVMVRIDFVDGGQTVKQVKVNLKQLFNY